MTNAEKAKIAWGENIPEWIRILAQSCDQSNQKRAAKAIGYSTTVVNQVLANKYPADLDAIRIKVEGALLGHTVFCPELGELRADICLNHQAAKFAATNHLRVRLYKACRAGCPNARNHEER